MFECCSRLPQSGDKYVFTRRVVTLGNHRYHRGDTLVIMARGVESPWGWKSSLGALQVMGKYGVSVWTSIENMVYEQDLVLVQPEKEIGYEVEDNKITA